MQTPPYDYLIVGAGSSGAPLAARLSEDPGVRVLLLEAGPDYRSAEAPLEMQSLNPTGMMQLAQFATHRWPQLLARRSAAQAPQPYNRGRGLGGSSAINGAVAIRGMLEDYDRWAAQGCVGWSGEELLPYFNRLEDDLDFGDAPYHGRGGPIPICRLSVEQWGAQDRALRAAALDLGYGWSGDHNAPDSTGVSPYAMNCRDGVRVSTNDAYLEPARGRPNLTIQGETLVDRVLFSGTQATGVRARTSDGWTTFAAQEIILSAGVFHSAAILLRSGIGPTEDLQALGVPVLQDAPVGHNLMDHAGAVLLLALRPEARPSLHDHWSDCCVRYSSGLAGAGANDMMIMSFSPSGFDEAGLAAGVLYAAAFQAFSRGRLRLGSTDPEVDPEVELGLLSDERDLVRLRDGARRLLTLVSHPAMRAITERVTLRGTDQDPSDVTADDIALDTWLLGTVSDTMHPVGTCRMGAPDDPRAVVDPDCRVIGIEGLRVIDGAIMPEVPRANTHLTCVMIAERMAARLKRDSYRHGG